MKNPEFSWLSTGAQALLSQYEIEATGGGYTSEGAMRVAVALASLLLRERREAVPHE